MPNVAVAPRPVGVSRPDNDRRMFGFLREIRAACQHLRNLIADTLARASLMGAPARKNYFRGALSTAVLDRVDHKIMAQLKGIQELFTLDVSEFEWCADNITTIELTWLHAKDLWPAEGADFGDIEQALKQIDAELDQIVYQCASLSLSPRVNDTLCNLRTGQPLDLEFEFGAEFPKDRELRKRLVQELAQESAVIDCGIVDVDQGVIYKVAASRREQKRSAWRLVVWLLLGFGIPVLLGFGDRVLAGWPLKFADLERLLVDYVLILIGSGAHFAVEALKTARAKTRPSFQALNDWVLWLHVRETQIRNGILYLFAGYTLLVFGVPKLDWASAFFAGYSIDSLTELFLDRFQTIAKTKTELLSRAAK